MKNKPLRHKESNTFRFQPFSERIGNINIDVFHRVRHRYEEESEEETYFYQTLEKWVVLNCSECFEQLRREITRDVQTLPQLLVLKDHLVGVLLKHLEAKDPLNLHAVLELTVALAKDLHQEFYPHYEEFLSRLITLLDTKDTDQLEWTFECLAYLFKFLWRLLVNNLPTVLEALLPLLGSSKPYYINNFAAESFAFVARKVKDQRKFVKLVLRSLKKFPDGTRGCGRLLYEIVSGVPGQLHSCAPVTLGTLYACLDDETLPNNLLSQVLSVTVSQLAANIQPKHSAVIWSTLLTSLEGFYSAWKRDPSEKNMTNVHHVLGYLEKCVEHKNCTLVIDSEPLVALLLKLIEIEGQVNQEVTLLVMKILSHLLLSPSLSLTQELASCIIHSALFNLKSDSLVSFISGILSFLSFEGLVLPRLLKLCIAESPLVMLPLLGELVCKKAPLSETSQELMEWKPYTLDFNSCKEENTSMYSEAIFDILSCDTIDDVVKNADTIMCAIVVLPNVLPVCKTTAVGKLKNLVMLLVKELDEEETVTESKVSLHLSLLSSALESIIHLKLDNLMELLAPETIIKTLLRYCSSPDHLSGLRALSFYICCDEKNETMAYYDSIRAKLIANLLSPYHKVRMLSTSILYELEKSNPKAHPKMLFLLENCWKSESTPASLQDYREKLKFIQKLECTESLLSNITDGSVDPNIPVNYLLGVLYVNFKLLWEPTIKVIASYGLNLSSTKFWPIFGPLLKTVGDCIRGSEINFSLVTNFKSSYLNEIFTNLNNLDERPDHVNFRLLLWKTMEEFPEVCELRNRDISTEFLTFLEEEYLKRNADQARTWDIRLKEGEVNGKKEDSINLEEEHEMEVDEEPDEDEEIKKALTEPVPESGLKFKLVTKTLLGHLRVFSMLRNPKTIYREPELNVIYHDLLLSKLPDVQKAALECLLTYKHKYLLPYKDHLFGIIDDKTFKTEIILFRVDAETELIRPEHRSDLLPIVLRIAYSKMSSPVGGKTNVSAKLGKQARRASVIRFLSGCKAEELIKFFHMSFRLFTDFKDEEVLDCVNKVMTNLDLGCVIPPKRLQSSMGLLNTFLIYSGGLLNNELLSYLLKILLLHGANVASILQSRDGIHPGYVKVMRNIRAVCFEALNRFFEYFESYTWSSNEIDAIFKVFVWPYLNKLPMEGIHSPTSLLKLFLAWSQNPRYFSLLGKYNEENSCPLKVIMELWLVPKAHGSVSNAIMDLVERLLTLHSEVTADSENPPPEIPVTNMAIVDENQKTIKGETMNYGSVLLLPYVPSILEKLRRKLSGKVRQGLAKRELEVMSRITELVSDPVSSETIFSLLLPVVVKKGSGPEHVVIPLLTTADNLMRNIPRPGRFVRSLAPLFASVTGPLPRRLLTSFIINLSKKEGSEGDLDAQLLGDLNAWDAKWIDQPDFNRRLGAFKTLENLVSEGKISINMGTIVIYTCFHFIRNEKDLSLREHSSYCLKTLCPALCKANQDNVADKQFLINDVILMSLKDGIRDKQNDNVRNDSITLLGCMARECSDLHPVLKDLSLLGNAVDLEVDFFENLQHLQLHRKVRAMLKFCEVAKDLEKALTTRTLTQFVLPLVSYYLCWERFSNKNTIVDAAIQALGTVCRFLPWHQYSTILRYYLGKLRGNIEFQKQLVRINIEILNAFHYDLSKAESSVVEMVIESQEKESEEKSPEEAQKTVDPDASSTAEEESNVDKGEEEILEEDLNKIDETPAEEEETAAATIKETIKAINRETKLTRSGSLRVIQTITTSLLPQLNKSMAQRTQAETSHKLNRKMMGPDRDEEDILRVPLAVAIVKLLQKLPKGILNKNLPGILMKLCTFLKSRLDSVRKVTRETLHTIMVSIGAQYLPTMISEMKALLTRGFHVHVMVYSIHSVLVALKPIFKEGDIDKCVHSLINICNMDLFGETADEKEVVQIAGKIMEARSNRSYDIFHIMAQYISENYMLDLIVPLKEELSKTLSHKNVTKVTECLNQVVLGLIDNSYITAESLLLFAYGTSTESIPALVGRLEEKPVDPKQREYDARKQPDTFIIPEEPKRQKAAESRACTRTNSHILVEFGLRLLYFLLKREKLKDQDYRPHLDPLVILLNDCLKSQHVKVSTIALQCFWWILKYDLPSLRSNLKTITKVLFSILHKYAAAGLSKGDNFDLVMAVFKAVAVLVRDVKYHKLEDEQLRALLLYCEQDLDDHSRQATAFSLLKAIVGRKLMLPEIHGVMAKVEKLSITATLDSVRLQARQVMHQFLMEYPLGKKMDQYLAFYYSQLSYDTLAGRASALEMLKTIVNTFPVKIILKQSGIILLHVGANLVNDNDPECRKQAAEIISIMLSKVDSNNRNKLFEVTMVWFTDTKISHRRLAAQLIGLFAACEKEGFESRLKEVFTEVKNQLGSGGSNEPGRFVRINVEEQKDDEETIRIRDHHLYQVLQMLIKVSGVCPQMLTNSKYTEDLEFIADHVHSLLNHPHEWVRLGSVQLLGCIISAIPASDISAAANNIENERPGYLLNNTRYKLKSLSLDLTSQLIPGEDANENLLKQCMKLLVIIAEIVKDIDDVKDSEDNVTLLWLVRRIRKLINIEIVQAPSSIIVRTMSFNWMAALALKLDSDTLTPLATNILGPLAREINTTEESNVTLRQVAKEAAVYVKRKIGHDLYNTVMLEQTDRLDAKRAERRKQRAQLVVTDPARAAKRKISKQIKKKELKKRKVELMKGQKFKRKPKKKEDVDLEIF